MEIDFGDIIVPLCILVVYGLAYMVFRMFVHPNLHQFLKDWPDVSLAPMEERLLFGSTLVVISGMMVATNYYFFMNMVGDLSLTKVIFHIGLNLVWVLFALMSLLALYDYNEKNLA